MNYNKTIQLTIVGAFFLMCPCNGMDDSQQIWQINDTSSHNQDKKIQEAYTQLLTLAKTNKDLFLALHAMANATSTSTQNLSETDYQYLQNNGLLTFDKKIPLIIKILIVAMIDLKNNKFFIISYDQLEKQEIIELIREDGLKTNFTVTQTTITKLYILLTHLLDESFYAFESLVKICNNKPVDFDANQYWKDLRNLLISLNFINNKGEIVSSLMRKLILIMTIFNYDSGEIRVRSFDELKAKGLIKPYDRTIHESTKKELPPALVICLPALNVSP
jgi:hypothetical protein